MTNDIHWGEAWCGGDFTVTKIGAGAGALPSRNTDPWIRVLSGGNVMCTINVYTPQYCDGMSPKGVRYDPIPPGHVNYYQPYNSFLDVLVERYWGPYQDVLWQHQSISWPDYSYERIKMWVIRSGYPIYRTTWDGYLYGPDPYTHQYTVNTFDYFFNGPYAPGDPDNIDWDRYPPVYFIDTVDGQPPRADGSNLVTLRGAGNSPLYYGIFFMGANMTFGGGGSPPTLDAPERPDRTIGGPILKCRLAGAMVSWGSITFGGAGNIYGSLYAEKGFARYMEGWGVYYNWRLGEMNLADCPVYFETEYCRLPEDIGVWSVPVVLGFDHASTVTVSMDQWGGTARGGGQDYSLPYDYYHPLIFPPHVNRRAISLTIHDDNLVERDEWFEMQIRSGTPPDDKWSRHGIIILDNDRPRACDWLVK